MTKRKKDSRQERDGWSVPGRVGERRTKFGRGKPHKDTEISCKYKTTESFREQGKL